VGDINSNAGVEQLSSILREHGDLDILIHVSEQQQYIPPRLNCRR
jgi:hypothetical protein